MSQIFTGSGLGLNNSSLDKLGSYGPHGNSQLSQSGERVYINAANGNLILRHNDGYLSDHDLGLNLVQTYNSQGQLNGNAWQFNVATKLFFAGSPNTVGSTVTRLDEAGHQSTYHFDEASGNYLNDSGSTERLRFDGNAWEYQSGSDDIKWRYDANGQLSQRINRDGLIVNYTFENGRLAAIGDSRGQKITFDYTGDLLTDVTATQDGTVVHHTHYEYDNLNRLKAVSQDLGDGKIYTTRYGYDGDSNRISDISQSDGTTFHIDYDEQGRVKQTIDGEGRTQRFDYLNNQTIITNDKNEQWIYSYDELGQLTGIDGPENLHIQYHYQGAHLSSITQGDLIWRFEYNANGDCTKIIDEKGQVTERVFDANHHLVCETHYSQFDDSHHVINPEHSYFIYDEKGHLRFEVAANGVVTEYQYNESGNKTAVITYLQSRLGTTNYNPNHLPTLEQVQSWAQEHSGAVDKADYEYDKLGQLIKQTHGEVVTNFVYDPAGRLIEKRENYQGQQSVTAYVYDDLGRLILTTDNRGHTQTIEYDDANRQIITTDANGLKTIQLFDKSGLLLSTHKLDATHDFGTTYYDYDEAGRLKKTTEPSGQNQVIFYDAQGRKQAVISNSGEVTEYIYDAYGNLKQTKAYATLIDVNQLTSNTDFASIKPNPSDDDRGVTNLYNAYNQLQYRIDATGAVIEYVYNAKGQIISEKQFATRLESWQGLTAHDITPQTSDDDRITKFYYDELGNKIADVNAEDYATEYQYDNRGLLIATIQHYNKIKVGNTWQQVKPNTSFQDIVTYNYYDDSGNKIATIDGEGYLTEYRYDERGNLAQQISYYTKLDKNSYDVDSDIVTLRPASHTNDHSTTYHYNDLNQLCEELSYTGLKTTYDYNEVGLVIKKTQTDTHTNEVREIQNRYDAMGRIIATLDEIGSALIARGGLDDNQIESIWQNHAIKFSYNLSGQLAAKTNQLGFTTQYFYDAENRLQFSVDADGNIKENRYNAFNQVAQEIHYSQRLQQTTDLSIEQLQAQISTLADSKHDEVITYHYTTTGLVDNKTVGVHQNIVHYNAFGQVSETIARLNSNQSNVSRYQYDKRGFQTHRFEDVYGLNRDIETVYDEFGRVKKDIINSNLLKSYTYDKNGNLYLISDALSNYKSIGYDAYGRKIDESDWSFSAGTTYIYNDKANEVNVLLDDGSFISTDYNAFGDKVKVTDANDNVTEYRFDEKGQLTKVINADASKLEYHYDAAGRLSWQLDGEKHKTSFTYDANDHLLTKTTDPDGLKITESYQYDGAGRKIQFTDPEERIKTFEYDAAGQLINSIVDSNGLAIKTHYEYDEAGNKVLEKVIDASGVKRMVKYSYDTANRLAQKILDPNGLQITESFEYDERDNLTVKTDPRGNKTQFIYDTNNQCRYSIDASGVVTEHVYSANGNEVKTIIYANKIAIDQHYRLEDMSTIVVSNPTQDRIEFNEYDTQDRLTGHVDAQGYYTEYQYDNNGNVISKKQFYLPATVDSYDKIHIQTSQYDITTSYSYDSLNQLRFEISNTGMVTERQYDATGNITAITHYAKTIGSVTDHSCESIKKQLSPDPMLDHTERFIYDAANRLHYHIDAQGYVTETQYDLSAHTQTTIQYANAIDPQATNISTALKPDTYSDRRNVQVFDNAGRETYRINSDGYVLEREYDATGNIIKEIAHAQKVSLQNLSFNSVQQALAAQSALDRITNFNYDEAGRLHETIDALLQSEVYEYDAAGNVTSKTDKGKHVWTYEYDAMNRLTREKSPETSITEYTDGRWQTVNRLIITRTDYDSFGNKVLVVSDEGHVNQTIRYEYDKLNRPVKSLTDVPIDASVLDPSSYNSSRQERVTTLTTETVYDAFGNVVAQKDRAGNWVHNIYDDSGNKTYEIGAQGELTRFEYDSFGNVVKQTRFANTITLANSGESIHTQDFSIVSSVDDRVVTNTYNNLNQLIQTDWQQRVNYDSTRSQYDEYSEFNPTTTYTYNAFGELALQRTKINRYDWAESRIYYDKQGRKRAEVNGENYVTEFEYNQFGEMSAQIEYANRTEVAHDSDYYPVHASSQDRRVEFVYDAIGQLSTQTLKNVTYQRLNGTAYETLSGDLTTTYTYDALGHQTSMRDAKGNTSYWYYDNVGNVRAQMGPAVNGVHQATLTYRNSFGEVSIEEQWANGATNVSVNGFDLVGKSGKDRMAFTYYNSQGNVFARTEFDSQAMHDTLYSYDANGNITRCWRVVDDADGVNHVNDIRYQYDASGHQTNTITIERNGQLIEQQAKYNAFGDMIEKSVNGKNKITYDYNTQGQVWRTNSEGNYQIFLYDLSGNLTQVVKSSDAFRSDTGNEGHDLSTDYYKTVINYRVDNGVSDLFRTDTQYDKAGHVIKQVNDDVEGNPTIMQSYDVDRWGNVVSHCDARESVTKYTYNAFNQVMSQELPTVAVMDEHGNITQQSPTLHYAYDELGNVIAMVDANGNQAHKEYDAYGRVIKETDAYGIAKHKEYDSFGNVVRITEAGSNGNRTTQFSYDLNNQLLTKTNNKGEVETYTNDALGHRLSQTNAMGERNTYQYDNRGNLITNTDIRGYQTSMKYDEAGHKIQETDANGNTQTWAYDDITGRLKSHTDIGENTTRYHYNTNGLLIDEQSDKGKLINYHYWANGLLRQYDDQGMAQLINYEYDANGNLTHKSNDRKDGSGGWMTENDFYEYDALGRMTSAERYDYKKEQRKFAIHYDYDAVNNIRHTQTHVNFFGSGEVIENAYFTYDANNRMLINKGELINGEIQITASQGSSMHYNVDGSIDKATTYNTKTLSFKTYVYSYDELGRTNVIQNYFNDNEKLISRVQVLDYDASGRVWQETLFNELGFVSQTNVYTYDNSAGSNRRGLLQNQVTYDGKNGAEVSRVTYKSYDNLGNIKSYRINVANKGNMLGFETTHTLEYEKAQGYQQTLDRATTKLNDGRTSSGVSLRYYDVNGNLQEARDVNGENSISYLNDSREGLKERREKDSVTGYLNVGGHVIADIKINKATNEQTLDVYGGFTPQGSAQKSENPYKEGTIGHALHSVIQWQQYSLIAGANINDFLSAKEYYENAGKDATGAPTNLASDNLGSYTVKGGDTLQSIALEVYGDASLWYLIADANGITDSQTRAGSVPGPVSPDDINKGKTNRTNSLQPGTQITIPPAANGQHHTNATHKVYNPQAMLGDTSATTPVPPPPPPPPQGKHHKCSMKNIIVGVVMTVATIATAGALAPVLGLGATGSLLGTMAVGMISGFVGSVASQGVAIALGMQKNINFKSALITGLASAATAGIATQFTGATSAASQASKSLFSASSAAQSMLNDASSQLVNMAFNKHQHFRWDELAGAGAAGGFMNGKVGKDLDKVVDELDASETIKNTLHSYGSNAATAAATGSHFNALEVLGQSFGNSVAGNATGGLVDTTKQTPLPKYDPAQLLEGDIYSQYFPTDQEAYDYAVATNQYAPIPAEGAYAEYRNDSEPQLESSVPAISQLQDEQQRVFSTLHDLEQAGVNYVTSGLKDGIQKAKDIGLSLYEAYKESLTAQEQAEIAQDSAQGPKDRVSKKLKITKKTESMDQHGWCWKNHNEISLSGNISVSMNGDTERAILAGMVTGQSVDDRLRDIVAEQLSKDSSIKTDLNGKVMMESKLFPSSDDYKYSYNFGIDPKTKLPFMGASISYKFKDYNLKTKYGEIKIKGSAKFENKFTPEVTRLCSYLIPIQRGAENALPYLQVAGIAAGMIMVAPQATAVMATTGYKAKNQLTALAKYGSSVAGGMSLATYSYANSNNDTDYRYYRSPDKTLVVGYEVYPIRRNKKL